MTKLFLKVYFAFLALVIWNQFDTFFDHQNAVPQFLSFARILNLIPMTDSQGYFLVLFLPLLFSGLGVLRPVRGIRITAAILFLILHAYLNSFGKIDHSLHVWAFASCFACFFRANEEMNSSWNIIVLRLIQSVFFCQYFVAGLWKLKEGLAAGLFSYLQSAGAEHLAYSLAQSNGPEPWLTAAFHQYPFLLSLGWSFAILFELSCLSPIIFPRCTRIWGFMAITFHTLTWMSMGIRFSSTVFGAVFFLLLAEEFIRTPSVVIEKSYPS